MIWHNSDINSVSKELATDINLGLTTEEAKCRLETYGYNKFNTEKTKHIYTYFIVELKKFHNISLAVITLVYFVLSLALDLENKFEGIVIIIALLLSVSINALLKYYTDRQLEITNESEEINATVIRDRAEVCIPYSQIVPGDLLVIKSGDYIKADARLIDSYALACEEFIITGETAPAEKHHDTLHTDITPIIDRQNMIYSGSTVLNGKGVAIVTETAGNTEICMRRSMELQVNTSDTTLTEKMAKIHHGVSIASLILCIFVFFIGIAVNFSNTQISFAVTVVKSLLLSCALYVASSAAIIPFLVRLSRCSSEVKLKRNNIFISAPNVTEELKEITVICTDKTGAITTEELSLTKIFNSHKIYNLKEEDCDDTSKNLLKLALICSNFSSTEHAERHTNSIEKAIEDSCVEYVGMSKTDIDGLFPKLAELPFDSERMLMTTVTAITGTPVAIVKGAPEIIASRCNNVDTEQIQKTADAFAKDGLKVIAVAIKPLAEIPANPNSYDLEYDLNFAGILGFEDKIDPDVKNLCKQCATSGIRVIMVTGDHFHTAVSTAIKAGIIHNENEALSSEALSSLSDKELEECVEKYSVFARVTPEDKLRIVTAIKNLGEKVLVTGDSINDARALIAADFGCALGITASDTIKNSADIVVGDNKFSSIINAIKQSFNVSVTIKKACAYLLSLQLVLAITILFGYIVFGTGVISSAGALVISLILLSLPLIALFIDNDYDDIDLNSSGNKLVSKAFLLKLFTPTVIISLCSLISYGIISLSNIGAAKASVFAIITLCNLFNFFSLSKLTTVITTRIFKSNALFALIISIVLILFFVLLPIGKMIGIAFMTGFGWLMVLISITLVLLSAEIIKIVCNKTLREKI